VLDPVPMNAVMIPVVNEMRRTRFSDTISDVPSTTTLTGQLTVAAVACPPFPVLLPVPVPVTVRTLQMACGDVEGDGVRLGDGVDVAVSVREAVADNDGVADDEVDDVGVGVADTQGGLTYKLCIVHAQVGVLLLYTTRMHEPTGSKVSVRNRFSP
jgi:hypothetical protein